MLPFNKLTPGGIFLHQTKKNKEISLYIKIFIDQNKYNSLKKIPSETYLCSKFHVSRETVRRSIQPLKKEGLLYSVKGSGTFFRSIEIQDTEKKQQFSFRIATIVQGQDSPETKEFIAGLKKSLANKNIELKLFFTDNKISHERACLKACIAGYDGIITDGVKASLLNPNLDLYRTIEQKNIRCLFYNNFYTDIRFPHIIIDNIQCAKLLVQKIIDKGHKDIGGIFFVDYYQGTQKYKGFIQTLADNDIAIKDENIKWLLYDNISEPAEFEKVIKKFLKKNTSTAIVCCNYLILKQVQKLSNHERELICFDYSENDWEKENILCSLNPSYEVGKKAGENMCKMLEDSNYKIHDYSYIFQPKIFEPK